MTETITPDQLKQRLRRLERDVFDAIVDGMDAAALNVEAEAKAYCQPGRSPYYRAPHITGTLQRSITSKTDVINKAVHGIVGAGVSYAQEVSYALAVHDGTSRMQARPFILDAIIAKERDTKEILEEHILKGIMKNVK